MNNVINKFLLTADKFMPETHLKDLTLGTYSACGPFNKHKGRINKFIQTGDTNYIYINELDKACFAHDAAYSDYKDIKSRTAADKILRDKAYKIAKDPKYCGSQRGLASMVYKFFEFYNRSMKSWLEKNDIEMYSAHNEGKSVVAERFIWTIKKKIYKYMTSILKNLYIDKLDDIVHKYSNKKHRTIKMKPIDVKDNTYIDFGKDNDPKFKVSDHVRISKYKNIFAKGYTPNWSEEVFVIKNIRNTVQWAYVIHDLNGEEITGTFYEKDLQKIDRQEFRIEKVIKKKGDKLYVKWKGYDNSFNSWIDKKDLA